MNIILNKLTGEQITFQSQHSFVNNYLKTYDKKTIRLNISSKLSDDLVINEVLINNDREINNKVKEKLFKITNLITETSLSEEGITEDTKNKINKMLSFKDIKNPKVTLQSRVEVGQMIYRYSAKTHSIVKLGRVKFMGVNSFIVVDNQTCEWRELLYKWLDSPKTNDTWFNTDEGALAFLTKKAEHLSKHSGQNWVVIKGPSRCDFYNNYVPGYRLITEAEATKKGVPIYKLDSEDIKEEFLK